MEPATKTWYFLATFFILAFVYFFWFGSYILFFQEQQSLFLYTSSYLSDFLLKPGGFLDLSGKFLTQFYFSKFAGSLILALILSLPGIILCVPAIVEPGICPICFSLYLAAFCSHADPLSSYDVQYWFSARSALFPATVLSKKALRYLVLAFFPCSIIWHAYIVT
jgi:hypothetical protein